ncbi:MAG: hypothetical protein JW976_14950 [Syntrophaceae bacterium]|nr:hypothetical protein [Syntrophaceae bacterium]
MNVKGTVFATGKNAIITVFGEEKWKEFMKKLAAKEKFFSNVIMPVTLIPEEKFALFLKGLIDEFFNGDEMQYITFGKVAANFALSPGGPYHTHLLSKNITYFAETVIPKLWTTYFDEGTLTAKLENNIVYINIYGLSVKRVYIEYIFAGYAQKGIKMFGKKVVEKCIRGFSKGDNDIYYQYEIQDL